MKARRLVAAFLALVVSSALLSQFARSLPSQNDIAFQGVLITTGFSKQTPISGDSITVSNDVPGLLIDPAGTLATLTVTMPSAPTDGQHIVIATTQALTSFTLNPNSGQSIKNAPTTAAAGGAFGYIYVASNTTWYPLTPANNSACLFALTGDVTSTGGSCATVVAKINGATLGTTTATSGNILIGDGSQWVTRATSGDVTINSTGVTAIGNTKVTNAMLVGSIAASKLVGTDIATVGTITSGTWNGTAIAGLYGGTGLTTAAVGDIMYASATTPTWSRLAAVATGSVLVSAGVNTAPAWSSTPTINGAVIIKGGLAGNSYNFATDGGTNPQFTITGPGGGSAAFNMTVSSVTFQASTTSASTLFKNTSNHPVGFGANNKIAFYIDGLMHMRATDESSSTPALSSCGTTPAIAGSDISGEVTMGTGSPTGCTITFANAYSSAPYCVVTWQSNLASMAYSISTSAITLTQTGTSSNKVNYHCMARSGG